MSENQDPAQKTEEPTAKKLADAEAKGQVAKSQEVGHWFMLLAIAIAIAALLLASGATSRLAGNLTAFIAAPHLIPLDGAHLTLVMWRLAAGVGLSLLPVAGLFWCAALAGNLIQHKPVFSAHKMKPELSKLSPMKGFKRLFSVGSLVEFAKGIAKISVVGVVAVLAVWPELDALPGTIAAGVEAILPRLRELALLMLAGVLAVMTLIAAADFLFQRYRHTQGLRMSKQEVKDEQKQSEGDPVIKQRLRQIRMERARRRMIAAVPEADVVVTNPSHYSVALKYDDERMAAPVLVAKGVDELALRIREIAQRNDVAIVANPPLARALHATVELDQEIPVAHYKAVAEIIGYVMRQKNKLPPRSAGGGGTNR